MLFAGAGPRSARGRPSVPPLRTSSASLRSALAPTPFVPLGHFPLTGGIGLKGKARAAGSRPYGESGSGSFFFVGAGHWPARVPGDCESCPYSWKRGGNVGSAKPGAPMEPHRLKFSTQTGRRRRPPAQSPAKRVCVGEEERWSELCPAGRSEGYEIRDDEVAREESQRPLRFCAPEILRNLPVARPP